MSSFLGKLTDQQQKLDMEKLQAFRQGQMQGQGEVIKALQTPVNGVVHNGYQSDNVGLARSLVDNKGYTV